MDITVACLIIGILAFTIGFITGILSKKEKTVGRLVIDHESVPEDEPYLFLETRVNPRTLMTKKTVAFEVVVEKLISHE